MNENETYDVIIIGGGAAGLAAAISAAWKCRMLGGEGVAGACADASEASGSASARAGADAIVHAAEGVAAGALFRWRLLLRAMGPGLRIALFASWITPRR